MRCCYPSPPRQSHRRTRAHRRADGPAACEDVVLLRAERVNASVPPELMARYAEFAEDDGDRVEHASAFKKAGGRYAVSYTDPAYVPYCFPPFVGPNATCRGQIGKLIHDERAWFHGPDGTRVRRYVDAHFGYQEAINPASAAARRRGAKRPKRSCDNGPIDLFLADDSGGPLHARDMSPKSSEFFDFNEAGVEITRDDEFRDQWIAYLSYAAKPGDRQRRRSDGRQAVVRRGVSARTDRLGRDARRLLSPRRRPGVERRARRLAARGRLAAREHRAAQIRRLLRARDRRRRRRESMRSRRGG